MSDVSFLERRKKHRRESLCWRIINYTALLQNTNIYTVYTESRVAGAQSNQLQNGNSEGPKTWSQSALSVKRQTTSQPPQILV